MNTLVLLAQIALMMRPPQDLPASRGWMRAAMLAYVASGAILLAPRLGGRLAMMMALADMVLLFVFVLFILGIQGRPGRIVQTMTALAGAGTLVTLAMMPFVRQIESGTAMDDVAGFVVYALFSWLLAVNAHIFRHAFELSNIFFGLAVAVIQYLFAEIMLAVLFSASLETLS